jgi:hypothetical protein
MLDKMDKIKLQLLLAQLAVLLALTQAAAAAAPIKYHLTEAQVAQA